MRAHIRIEYPLRNRFDRLRYRKGRGALIPKGEDLLHDIVNQRAVSVQTYGRVKKVRLPEEIHLAHHSSIAREVRDGGLTTSR